MGASHRPRRPLRRVGAVSVAVVIGGLVLAGPAEHSPARAQTTTTIGLSLPTGTGPARPSTTIALGGGSTIPGSPSTTIDVRVGGAPGPAATPTTVGLGFGEGERSVTTTGPDARVLGTQETDGGGLLASTGARVVAAAVTGVALVAAGFVLRGATRRRHHPAR